MKETIEKINIIANELEAIVNGLILPMPENFHIEELKAVLPKKVEKLRAIKLPAKLKQVGGNHYLGGIDPRNYAKSHKLGYDECLILRYVTRHSKKNGKKDLLKAKHLLEILIEEYEANEN